MYTGRSNDAARVLDAAGRAIAGQDGHDYGRSWLQSARVDVGLFVDDEDEEIAQARLAMALAEGIGNPSNLALALFALGWALRHRDPDESIRAFDAYVALAKHAPGTNTIPSVLSHGARVAASQGDANGARTRLKEALEESSRDDEWSFPAVSLDNAVDVFCCLGDPWTAVVLGGAVETSFAPLRWPYIASRGPDLVVRTTNLARARETLGDTQYERARAQGAAMTREAAVAFALQQL
jgi:hypothetical protein